MYEIVEPRYMKYVSINFALLKIEPGSEFKYE